MPILKRSPFWGSDMVVGLYSDRSDYLSYQDSRRGGWHYSRMSEGYHWADSPRFLFPVGWGGTTAYKRLAGITKDATGAPLAGVTVMAIRSTADDANSRPANVQEGTVGVSDAAGNYEVMVPTGDQYRIDAYKAGAPDVAGSTLNTLVGA